MGHPITLSGYRDKTETTEINKHQELELSDQPTNSVIIKVI